MTGARFAKWRAVLKIADGGPSLEAMESNAHGLAAYAKIAQVSLTGNTLGGFADLGPSQGRPLTGSMSWALC